MEIVQSKMQHGVLIGTCRSVSEVQELAMSHQVLAYQSAHMPYTLIHIHLALPAGQTSPGRGVEGSRHERFTASLLLLSDYGDYDDYNDHDDYDDYDNHKNYDDYNIFK